VGGGPRSDFMAHLPDRGRAPEKAAKDDDN